MITASATAASSPGAVERMITADGLDWHVVEMGQGPAIVLVHGTAASVHSWRHVMPVLAQTNYVVAMDLPGHAGTKARSSRDYSLERMGRGVSALVDALKITPSIVAGHSAGAAILVWACAHKLLQPSSLVSFNGAFYPFGGIAGTLFFTHRQACCHQPVDAKVAHWSCLKVNCQQASARHWFAAW